MSQAAFSDARDAIRWADNYLLKPDCKTITGKLMEDNIQQPRMGGGGDSRWLAIVISSTVSKAGNGKDARLIHGRGEWYRLDVAGELAHATWRGPGGGKTIAVARDLGLLVIEQVKERERYGRRLATTKIIDELDMKKSTYYERWGATHKEMASIFMARVDKGISEITNRLIDVGVVG